tara:strand:+ start:68 stop:643 length:576 start_codon:yes stop_codon:yes gene_type:complete
MKKLFKFVLKVFLFFLGLLSIWIVCLFFDLPVIPFNETNYYLKHNENSLNERQIIKTLDSLSIRLEIPNYFEENGQCFDVWFYSDVEKKNLSVDSFLFELKNLSGKDENLIDSILFWDGGSQENTSTIDNYKFNSKNKYIFFRKIYNLDGISDFSIKLNINYSIDSIQYKLDTLLNINKKKKLTWDKFRVH